MDAEVKISTLEETLTQFMLTQNEILKVNILQNLLNEKQKESMKRLEGKMSSLSQQISSLANERENCDAVELRNHTFPSFSVWTSRNKIVEQSSEKNEKPKPNLEDKVSSETIVRGKTLDKFIDKDSPFRRTNNQIINEPTLKLPDYIKPPYPFIKKKLKREMEVGKFKKFLEMLTAL